MDFKKQLTLIVETDDDTILDDLNKLANLCEEIRNTCFTIKRKINCKATDEKKKDYSEEQSANYFSSSMICFLNSSNVYLN